MAMTYVVTLETNQFIKHQVGNYTMAMKQGGTVGCQGVLVAKGKIYCTCAL